MHYLMNKNTPVLSIETLNILNFGMLPLALHVNEINNAKVIKWITHRALPLSRKHADNIYSLLGLSRDNQEIDLIYLTHGLSINDNYWIASDNELGSIKYENINLFTNSYNEAMYLVALRGDKDFSITSDDISAEYTGQGTYPKCFVRKADGIYIYKSGTVNDIRNEVYACYIAEILGADTAHYEYVTFENVDCTKSKIVTNLYTNWESAFILSEMMYDTFGKIPQEVGLSMYTVDYVNMIILDAIILNADRHMKNWSFEIDANTNRIIGLSPNYDFNQAFCADNKTMSNLLFDGDRRMNILHAGREAYRKFGTTLNLHGLYNILDDLSINIDKNAMKNRILYILGKRDNQRDCY